MAPYLLSPFTADDLVNHLNYVEVEIKFVVAAGVRYGRLECQEQIFRKKVKPSP